MEPAGEDSIRGRVRDGRRRNGSARARPPRAPRWRALVPERVAEIEPPRRYRGRSTARRQISRMKRVGLAILAAWLAWPVAGSAHDVPDLVNVAVFFKPENGRLQVLVRVPSNAFIDFQFPVLDATWLDLSESEAIAAAAVKVWVADRLSLFENRS